MPREKSGASKVATTVFALIFVPFRPISCFLWDVNSAQVPSATAKKNKKERKKERKKEEEEEEEDVLQVCDVHDASVHPPSRPSSPPLSADRRAP